MDNRRLFACLLAFLIGWGCSCRDHAATGVVQTPAHNSSPLQDPLIEANADIVRLENEEINLLIQRYGWDMEKTPSGLRYQITRETQGRIPKPGDQVSLNYVMKLLSGETVYDSQSRGSMTFSVEQSEAISGLHEAVRQMREGETARLVIPSYLGYGASGDGAAIGRYAPLVMIVELTEVSNINK